MSTFSTFIAIWEFALDSDTKLTLSGQKYIGAN
jgi:hypothetical protein